MATRFVKASQNRQYPIQLHAVEGDIPVALPSMLPQYPAGRNWIHF
jgi:hypothetical protein